MLVHHQKGVFKRYNKHTIIIRLGQRLLTMELKYIWTVTTFYFLGNFLYFFFNFQSSHRLKLLTNSINIFLKWDLENIALIHKIIILITLWKKKSPDVEKHGWGRVYHSCNTRYTDHNLDILCTSISFQLYPASYIYHR